LPLPLPEEEFRKWPRIPSDVFVLGFSAKDLAGKLQEKGFTQPVWVYDPPGPKIVVRAAPLEQTLRSGNKYRFRIETAAFEEMAFLVGNQPVPLTRKPDGGFESEITPRKGDLRVIGRLLDVKTYDTILRYKVD